MPLQQTLQLFCNHCKKQGHKETQCYLKQRNFQKASFTYRPPDQVNQLQTECLDSETIDTEIIQQEIEKLIPQEIQDIEYQLSAGDYILSGDTSLELERPEDF